MRGAEGDEAFGSLVLCMFPWALPRRRQVVLEEEMVVLALHCIYICLSLHIWCDSVCINALWRGIYSE